MQLVECSACVSWLEVLMFSFLRGESVHDLAVLDAAFGEIDDVVFLRTGFSISALDSVLFVCCVRSLRDEREREFERDGEREHEREREQDLEGEREDERECEWNLDGERKRERERERS